MSFTKRVSDLKQECADLGIAPTPTKRLKNGEMKFLKDDYITALRNNSLNCRYPQGIPYHLHYMLQIPSPMLAARFNELREEQQREVWASPEWIFEEKFDGCRMLLIYVRGEGLHLYSRNISQVDYCPCEYTNVWTRFDLPSFELANTGITSAIIDTEIMSSNSHVNTVMGGRGVLTETHLQAVAALLQLNAADSIRIQQEQCPLYFQAFDLLLYNGDWLTDLIYRQRVETLSNVLPHFTLYGMDTRQSLGLVSAEGKRGLYDGIVEGGGEGVVAKRLDSTYKMSRNRDKQAWVKIKRSMTETLQSRGLADTLDAWISGFELGEVGKAHENKVGTLVFHCSVDGTPHELARVSGLTDADRDDATVYDAKNGLPSLNPEWMGRVAELDGQCISARNKRLKHARILRWRPDKSPETCLLSLPFLESMIL